MDIGEEASAASTPHAPLFRIWAGLECGVVAGVLVLIWYALHSGLRAEVWWAKFNVAAWQFYGPAVYQRGLGRATLVGASFLMLIYAALGAIFGVLASLLPRVPPLAAALLYAAMAHAGLTYALRPLFGYWAPAWFSTAATMPAHLILAAMLTRWPTVFRKLAQDFALNDA